MAGPLRTATQSIAPSESDRSADHRHNGRLAKNQPEDAALGETERLQHTNFAHPFAHRHRHRVGGNQQDGKSDRAANRHQDHLDVAEEGKETQTKRVLALGTGGRRRVAEEFVHFPGDARNVFGGIRQDGEGASAVADAAGRDWRRYS